MRVRSIWMFVFASMFTVSLVAAQDNAPGNNNWVRLLTAPHWMAGASAKIQEPSLSATV